MANEIKVSINNTDYELEEVNCWVFDKNIPFIQFGGKAFMGKAIPKQPSIGYEILECMGAHNIVHPYQKGTCLGADSSVVPCTIHKVRRLPDKVEFAVDDVFTANAGCNLTIKMFEVFNNLLRVYSKEYGYWLLDEITKVEQSIPLKKPPLGLRPRFIWEEERLDEIDAAVKRYLEDGKEIPTEWVAEYSELKYKINTSK